MQKDTMIRKQLYITRAQDRAIKERAKREGLRESEVVREAIDRHVRGEPHVLPKDEARALARLRAAADKIAEEHPFPSDFRFKREKLYAEREERWIRGNTAE